LLAPDAAPPKEGKARLLWCALWFGANV
jgi:hypothetical protein